MSYVYDYGNMVSSVPTESFSIKSFVAASAWSTNQEWTVTTYTYANGSFTAKGSENIYLSQSAETVKLGKLGKNIAEISIRLDNLGSAGNTCSYGAGTYGYQMVWGDVKVKWNGKIPASVGHHNIPVAHHHIAPHAAQIAHTGHVANAAHQSGAHHTSSGYHSQLLSLHHETGLTSHFNLPQVEHSL
jgi:hypothetical protein